MVVWYCTVVGPFSPQTRIFVPLRDHSVPRRGFLYRFGTVQSPDEDFCTVAGPFSPPTGIVAQYLCGSIQSQDEDCRTVAGPLSPPTRIVPFSTPYTIPLRDLSVPRRVFSYHRGTFQSPDALVVSRVGAFSIGTTIAKNGPFVTKNIIIGKNPQEPLPTLPPIVPVLMPCLPHPVLRPPLAHCLHPPTTLPCPAQPLATSSLHGMSMRQMQCLLRTSRAGEFAAAHGRAEPRWTR